MQDDFECRRMNVTSKATRFTELLRVQHSTLFRSRGPSDITSLRFKCFNRNVKKKKKKKKIKKKKVSLVDHLRGKMQKKIDIPWSHSLDDFL